jgi:hypothetical protein
MQPPASTSGRSPQLNSSSTPTAHESLELLAHSPLAQVASSSASSQPPPAYENIYTEICTEIIKAQDSILGLDVALEQAKGVEGLRVDPMNMHSTVTGDGSKVINDLIEKYRTFFGYAAVEVCREAAARFLVRLPSEQTPTLLHAAQI